MIVVLIIVYQQIINMNIIMNVIQVVSLEHIMIIINVKFAI